MPIAKRVIKKSPFFISRIFYAKPKIDTLLRKTISSGSFFRQEKTDTLELVEKENESKG
jgi:hypothetical protein